MQARLLLRSLRGWERERRVFDAQGRQWRHLRQGQRPVCSSCQTQLSLGEEMVQWVSNFTAPSPRTNSWTGKAERTIKHLFFTYEFILRMHCYISISRLISIFISSRSLSLGSFEGLRSYLLQCRITRLLHEHCKLLSPFSFTL